MCIYIHMYIYMYMYIFVNFLIFFFFIIYFILPVIIFFVLSFYFARSLATIDFASENGQLTIRYVHFIDTRDIGWKE